MSPLLGGLEMKVILIYFRSGFERWTKLLSSLCRALTPPNIIFLFYSGLVGLVLELSAS